MLHFRSDHTLNMLFHQDEYDDGMDWGSPALVDWCVCRLVISDLSGSRLVQLHHQHRHGDNQRRRRREHPPQTAAGWALTHSLTIIYWHTAAGAALTHSLTHNKLISFYWDTHSCTIFSLLHFNFTVNLVIVVLLSSNLSPVVSPLPSAGDGGNEIKHIQFENDCLNNEICMPTFFIPC